MEADILVGKVMKGKEPEYRFSLFFEKSLRCLAIKHGSFDSSVAEEFARHIGCNGRKYNITNGVYTYQDWGCQKKCEELGAEEYSRFVNTLETLLKQPL